MEVHAHTHIPASREKKWTHYLWEFLMLFLAVFCGFLAEYLLEHRIESEREEQFISSLVSDLKDDTLTISKQIENIKTGIQVFDSLSMLLGSPALARENGEAVYYTARLGVRLSPLVNNNRTIDQLKNSGGFRLIREQETSNRIMKYYSAFPELRMIEQIFGGENVAFKEVASKIMNQTIYRDQINVDGSVARIQGNLSLLSYDATLLNQLGFYAVQMNGSRTGMVNILQNLKQSAAELLDYLQKTYHLK
jgi:hypothetical protein